jgi:hypothetical protein
VSGGNRLRRLDDLLFEADPVVDVLELAVLDVERVAAEARAVREQDAGRLLWKFVYRRPRSAIRLMFGVSIRPPNGSIAEKPTSSSTM